MSYIRIIGDPSGIPEELRGTMHGIVVPLANERDIRMWLKEPRAVLGERTLNERLVRRIEVIRALDKMQRYDAAEHLALFPVGMFLSIESSACESVPCD